MDKKWSKWRNQVSYSKLILLLLILASTANSQKLGQDGVTDREVDNELKHYVDRVFSVKDLEVVPGIKLKVLDNKILGARSLSNNETLSVMDYFQDRLDEFARSHSVSVNMQETARFLFPSGENATSDAGKSSFLTGFGMGFLAFALKKLLLPVVIGAQLVKSVMIAMFLPSLLGGLGKIVGKGLSTFSGISGASTGINNNHQQQLEEFEFKDTDPYNNDPGLGDNLNAAASDDTSSLSDVDVSSDTSKNSRFGFGNHRVAYVPPHSDQNSYITRLKNKKTDYKVFHKIPSSSVILAKFDPFYSPLLSRLDAIFQQLGLGNDKSQETERCRERLVCMMYANPAKYAPYSNLVSALLSKELNELKKPSLADPEIFRFFRYMKAAKDGQDGQDCQAYSGCTSLTAQETSPAMLTTFNDINKLVLARKFN